MAIYVTGDMHAITSANNLLCAAIDNHIHQGNDTQRRLHLPHRIPALSCMVLERLLCIVLVLHTERHSSPDAQEPEYKPYPAALRRSVGICSSDHRLA